MKYSVHVSTMPDREQRVPPFLYRLNMVESSISEHIISKFSADSL